MRRLLLLCSILPGLGLAEITVTTGPTTIPRGDAQSAGDITVNNGKFAVAFAVETAPPWGVARGGIVDIAIVRNGKVGYDIASLADFMPNNWSAWPTSYQRVTIEQQSPSQVIVRTERDWGVVRLATDFRIRDDDSRIDIVTTMENNGKQDLEDLLTGYVVWPDGGYLFSVTGRSDIAQSEIQRAALTGWSAAYDENWALGLHAAFAEIVSYDGRDRYLAHSLAAGDKTKFEATLQIVDRGDLSPLIDEDIRRRSLAAGRVHGTVTDDDGRPVAVPAVVVSRNGKPYAWTVGENGRFSMRLPEGRYSLYATADAYSRSATTELIVAPGKTHELDFGGLQPPGTLAVTVRSKRAREPLDARISVESGPRSLIEYFGKNTFFTELEAVGRTELRIAPGPYRLRVSAAGGFTSMPQAYDIEVAAGETAELNADIVVTARPQDRGWYSADLHHHSDVLDGFTPPGFVLRSELASGVDLTFLSDHDSVANNEELGRLSRMRGVEFIAGTELSPSWAHFNAYPVDEGRDVEIEVGSSSVQQIFAEARRLGADVIHVNHPFGDYGYFRSLNLQLEVDGQLQSAVPGGYDDGFDVIEMTAGNNDETIEYAYRLWNGGKRAYLAGGSDVHDVWNEVSGGARTYVYIDGAVTAESFVAALKRGNAFASQGPLVYPEVMFGMDLDHRKGAELHLVFGVQAAAGLRSIRLIERGRPIDARELAATTALQQVVFTSTPDNDTWYSVIVEDQGGKLAWSNPVWVRIRD